MPGPPGCKDSSRSRRLESRRHAGGGSAILHVSHSSPLARPAIPGLRCSQVNEPPSVALTQRFLSLCEHHGSQHLVVKLVAVGRGTGVAGLSESDDWTTWDAGQMRAAVEYLEHLRVR